MGQREDNPNYPGIEGVWFKVIDKDGNAVDLTPYSPQPVDVQGGEPGQIIVDDNDVHLGWFPTTVLKAAPSDVQQLKSVIIDFMMTAMQKKSDDYDVSVDGSGNPSDDATQVDYDSVGLKRNEPLIFTERSDDKTDNDDDNNDDKDGGTNGNNDKEDGGTANDDGKNDNDNNDDGNGLTNNDDNDNGTEDDNNNTNKGTSDDKEDNASKGTDSEEDNDNDNGRSKSNSKRDYHPRRPGVKGFWFSVIDKYGNSLDLSASFKYWDSSPSSAHGTDVAWLPIHGRYTAHALKRRVLKKLGKLKKMKDWGVYDEEGDSVAYDDSSRSEYVDLDNYGLRKKRPIAVKELREEDDSDSDDGSGKGSDSGSGSSSSSSSSDDEMPPPDITDTSSQGQNSSSADPYRLFTKRIQCMSNADWSRYEGSIQNTYQGEILWTDGNLSYGVANMMAYLAVRRVPNTPTGNVVAVGRAANESAYFVYLG
ncbi:hypothetical protein CVT26_005471 [Gymnopilus dilepis]|uniref:Uncharacterized protein n=1 Tax=Gymnopilus dilepis TaxID=231916 RepID=A0A409YT84_9AGAR|nr:hypothetical protein CVT26_005471 [Gymnopilus dilepis]